MLRSYYCITLLFMLNGYGWFEYIKHKNNGIFYDEVVDYRKVSICIYVYKSCSKFKKIYFHILYY